MRLRAQEVAAIKSAAAEAFGETAIVRLFGSRVDDRLQGGDIDLHVEVDAAPDCEERRWMMQRRLWRDLHEHEKIDLLVSQRGGMPRGFERVAYRDGVVL